MALPGADQYKSIDTKDKLKDKDLLFAATFDRGTVNADFAKGEPLSTNMKNVGLLLRGMIGFDGKPAFRPEPGEDLMFDAVKNVNPHQGTVTMWLCCRDYIPKEGKWQKCAGVLVTLGLRTNQPGTALFDDFEYFNSKEE